MATQQRIRIIGGTARGRTVHSGNTDKVRPTPSSVREALANMLRSRLRGSRILDLYAGFGSVGLEMLSQGAEEAVFIEKDHRVADIIRRNVDELDFDADIQVWTNSAISGVDRLVEDGREFDILFADPPYNTGAAVKILQRLAAHPDLMAPGAVVIVQHSSHEPLPEREGGLALDKERRTGDTVLSLYRTPSGEDDEETDDL